MVYHKKVKRTELDEHLANVHKQGHRIIVIVPTMLTYFGASPERYEVSEFLVLSEGI